MDKTLGDEEFQPLLDASPVVDRLLGQTVGQDYFIERLIGSGARGKVYAAFHKSLQQRLAIKFLLEEADNEHLSRFRREAQTLMLLKHSNIVCVRDYGFHDYRPFIVMDLVEGVSLDRQLADSGRLTDTQSRSVFTQAAAALDHAHQHGILHRDIKPANIMLVPSTDGGYHLLIVDFGLAKVHSEDGKSPTGLTHTGAIVGTPQYMSPEQCSGGDLDPRSDIYSLGCVMYEMVTGKRCVDSTTLFDCLHKQINLTPPAFDELKDHPVSSTLEDVIFRCLAKDRENRYSTANELHAALLATADTRKTLNPKAPEWWKGPTKKKRRRRQIASRSSLPSRALLPIKSFDRLMAALIDAFIMACVGAFWLGVVHLLAQTLLAGAVADRLPKVHQIFPLLFADWFAGGLLLIPIMLWWSSSIPLDASDPRQLWFGIVMVLGLYCYGAGSWIYRAGLECSKVQATPGKMMLGLVVTDSDSIRLTFGAALLRNLARPLSLVLMFDAGRILIRCLVDRQNSLVAIRQIALLPAHDWISHCQVRQQDDPTATLSFNYAIVVSGAAVALALAGNGNFFVAWFLSVILIAVAGALLVGCIHRLFMLWEIRSPSSQSSRSQSFNPWLATMLNLLGLTLMSVVQLITLHGTSTVAGPTAPAAWYAAFGGPPQELATEIVPGLSIGSLSSFLAHNHALASLASKVSPPMAIAVSTLLVFIIYAWLGKQLTDQSQVKGSLVKWISPVLGASLSLVPLLWFTARTQTRCLGVSLGFLIAFLIMSKLTPVGKT